LDRREKDGADMVSGASFVHLHVHSAYSIGLGLATPEELCAHAARTGFDSLALTDSDGTYGYIEFHRAANRHGLKPIYGAVVHHTSIIDPGREQFVMTLLAADAKGLENVAALASLSAASHENSVGLLLDQLGAYSEGVIALVGSPDSEVTRLLLAGDEANAAVVMSALRDVFEDRLYLEIQDHGEPEEKQLARHALVLAQETGVPPVLTQEVRYTGDELRELYALMSGVQNPNQESDFFRIDDNIPNRSMSSSIDMKRMRTTYPEAYANTRAIERRIPGDLLDSVQLIGKEHALFRPGEDMERVLLDRCTEAFDRRFVGSDEEKRRLYLARIRSEVSDIVYLELAEAFLFFSEVLSKFRRSGIHPGPATGYNIQSLCAHLLDITSYDPYQFDKRFHPMFDRRHRDLEVQLGSGRQKQAVRILQDAVGDASVAYLPSVERITPARAVRMVSQIVESTDQDVETILEIIGKHSGSSIKNMTEEDHKLGALYKRSISARPLLRNAALLEHLPCGFIRSRRSVGVSTIPLTDMLGHAIDPDSGDVFLQCSRDVLPAGSIYRIDLTPLVALATVQHADEALKDAEPVDWNRLDMKDANVWRNVRSGDPTGVFLLEGQAMQQYREPFDLHGMTQLTNFLALMRQRTGSRNPLRRIELYMESSKLLDTAPAKLRPVLEPTRGHLMYHEQLRDVLQIVAGRSPVDAARMLAEFREATPSSLSAVRFDFMRGAADENVSMEQAELWFERVLYFASRTISRERVLADALLVYKMFYLKTHHPAEFYASLLNAYWNRADRLSTYIDHVRENYSVREVSVNESQVQFTIEGRNVRVGLCAVHGLDVNKAIQIARLRGTKKFESVTDFVDRAEDTGITRDDIKRLIRAGAFDWEDVSRKELLDELAGTSKRKPPKKRAKPGQLELPLD